MDIFDDFAGRIRNAVKSALPVAELTEADLEGNFGNKPNHERPQER